MSAKIDDEDPSRYYKTVAEELERIARTVIAHPAMDRGLSQRLLAFAEQIRRDSDIDCATAGCAVH